MDLEAATYHDIPTYHGTTLEFTEVLRATDLNVCISSLYVYVLDIIQLWEGCPNTFGKIVCIDVC